MKPLSKFLKESVNSKNGLDQETGYHLINGKVRVFKDRNCREWLDDFDISEIESRGRDIKVLDANVNRVKLVDGRIGYVWAASTTFD